MQKQSSWVKGIKSGLPVALGYFPIAIAFGALSVQAQLSWSDALLMSLLVFAGASQFVSLTMILAGAGAFQIILTTFFLNLRHLIMSLAVNNHTGAFPRITKYFLSFFITDETFALITLGGDQDHQMQHSPGYFGGMMLTAYTGWVSGTLVGALSAGFIPVVIATAMTAGLYGLFIGLLVPPARKSIRFGLIALVSMVLNWLLGLVISSGWAIVLATVLAAGLGIFMEQGKK